MSHYVSSQRTQDFVEAFNFYVFSNIVVSKKKNPLFVWWWDRKISPLRSLSVTTRQALWCQWWSSGQIFLSHPHTHLIVSASAGCLILICTKILMHALICCCAYNEVFKICNFTTQNAKITWQKITLSLIIPLKCLIKYLSPYIPVLIYTTVKPVLSDHSKMDKTKVLMTNGSLMKVKSIAEFCNSFDLH